MPWEQEFDMKNSASETRSLLFKGQYLVRRHMCEQTDHTRFIVRLCGTALYRFVRFEGAELWVMRSCRGAWREIFTLSRRRQ